MSKKIVIALGGNALGNNLEEQKAAVKITSKAIVDLVEAGNQVVIAHGNGPQVGMINIAFATASKTEATVEEIPMDTCVAMSQGYIGFDLQNALREELLNRNLNIPVATIITQVIVQKEDPAFENPSKPIGSFYSKEEASEMSKKGISVVEDSGRGYRKVVASPKPISIVEKDIINTIINSGQIVIAGGGGGVPVISNGNILEGVSAVVDKDFTAAKLAETIDADFFIILTAVEKVSINFGKENEKQLDSLTKEEAEKYIAEGHFAKGSMLPKVEAALSFVVSKKGRVALITKLEKAKDGIIGKTGTKIIN